MNNHPDTRNKRPDEHLADAPKAFPWDNTHSTVQKEPIAIIGIGCRFPQANGPEAFWQLLLDGVDAITEVPAHWFDINFAPAPAFLRTFLVIPLDYAGRRTYDTCYRARDIFEVRDVILVTQRYHLSRALYTCNALGVNAVGVPADRGKSPYLYGNLRELAATLNALWEVYISRPLPVLGKPEPIFSSGVRLFKSRCARQACNNLKLG